MVLGEEGVPDPSTYPSSVEINVLANDKDPDGDPLKVATIAETKVDTDPTTDTPDIVTLDKGMATVKLNANGSLTYTEVYPDFQLELDGSGDVPIDPDPILPPQAVFYLETWPVDGFTYTVTDDKEAESNAATVTVYRQVPVLGTDLGAEPAGVLDPLDPLLA